MDIIVKASGDHIHFSLQGMGDEAVTERVLRVWQCQVILYVSVTHEAHESSLVSRQDG